MAGKLTTGNLAKALDRVLLRATANRVRGKITPDWRKMVHIIQSDNSFERVTRYDPTGFTKVKPEGTGVQYDRPTPGHSKDFVIQTRALGGIITKEMADDARHREMIDVASMLGDSVVHSINAQVADLVTNGFDTTYYTAGDGVAHFSASHQHPNGRTYSSLLAATPIAPGAIATAMLQIRAQRNARNQPLNQGRGSWLLVYSTQDTVKVFETLKTMQMPYTADNTENWVARQNILPVENQYFTGHEWLLMDAEAHDFTYVDRQRVQISTDGDFQTGDKLVKVVYRNAVGLNYALGIVGCQGGA